MPSPLCNLARAANLEDEDDGRPFDDFQDEPAVDPAPPSVIYFDPDRFTTENDLDNLKQLVQARFRPDEDHVWDFRALHPDSLQHGSPLADGKVNQKFLARGYATEHEAMPIGVGKRPLMAEAKRAQKAFYHAVLVAHSIIEIVQDLLGDARPQWLQGDPEAVLAPMAGKRSGGMPGNPTVKRDVPLLVQDGLLYGCANFTFPRRVLIGAKVAVSSALAEGREAFEDFCDLAPRAHAEVLRQELRDRLEANGGDELSGIALWACQQVARLRLAAGKAEIFSGSAAFHPETMNARIEATRRQMAKAIADRYDGVLDTYAEFTMAPADDLYTGTVLAFHDGWLEPLCDGWDDRDSRDANFACEDLRALAHWVGSLRRLGYATLRPSTAHLLTHIVLSSEDDNYGSTIESTAGKAATDFIFGLLPQEFWERLWDAARSVLEDGRSIGVQYEWSNLIGPLYQPRVQADARPLLVCRGPLLAFPDHERRQWIDAARRLGPAGLLLA